MMTSFGRLQILKQLNDSVSQSYLVFDPRRGEEVILHILPEVNNLNRESLEDLDQALKEAPGVVIERGNLLGVRYVVGSNSPEFQSLIQQFADSNNPNAPMEQQTEEMVYSRAAEAAATGRIGPAPHASTPGEFTRLFAAQPGPDITRQETPQTSESVPSVTEAFHTTPVVVSESQSAEPGEFTCLFQTPPVSASPTTRTPAPGALPKYITERSTNPSVPADPFSFTKEFQNVPVPALDNERTKLFELPAKPSSPPAQQPTSDYAKFFESPLGPSGPDVDFRNHVPPPEPAAPRRAGEFTDMFGAPFSNSATRRPMDSGEGSSNATGVFSRPSPNVQPIISRPGGIPPPGGYTGMFEAPDYVPRGAPPQSPAPPAKPPIATSTVVIIGVLALLLILAVAVILYFALRR